MKIFFILILENSKSDFYSELELWELNYFENCKMIGKYY